MSCVHFVKLPLISCLRQLDGCPHCKTTTLVTTLSSVVRFRMDTSVFGVSNTVPDCPKWLMWTVCEHTPSMENAGGATLKARERKYSRIRFSREPVDAMRHNGVKRWISRSCATGEWTFEHCEAFLTPLRGIAVDLSRHRMGTLIRLRDAISAAPSLLLEPSGRPSETDARASAR